jgi:hypothetical protein
MSEAVKNTVEAGESGNDDQQSAKLRGTAAMSRIKLALLEQYSRGVEKHGADPYNTTADKGAPKDAWRGNARRI